VFSSCVVVKPMLVSPLIAPMNTGGAPWTMVGRRRGRRHQTSPQIPPEPTAYFVNGQAYAGRQMNIIARPVLPL